MDPELTLSASSKDFIRCIKKDRVIRSIYIKSDYTVIVDVLASDTEMSDVDIYDVEPIATLTFGKDSGYSGKFSFPAGNNYENIAIRPSGGSTFNLFDFEVGIE